MRRKERRVGKIEKNKVRQGRDKDGEREIKGRQTSELACKAVSGELRP